MGIVCRQISEVGSVYPRNKGYNLRQINPIKLGRVYQKSVMQTDNIYQPA